MLGRRYILFQPTKQRFLLRKSGHTGTVYVPLVGVGKHVKLRLVNCFEFTNNGTEKWGMWFHKKLAKLLYHRFYLHAKYEHLNFNKYVRKMMFQIIFAICQKKEPRVP